MRINEWISKFVTTILDPELGYFKERDLEAIQKMTPVQAVNYVTNVRFFLSPVIQVNHIWPCQINPICTINNVDPERLYRTRGTCCQKCFHGSQNCFEIKKDSLYWSEEFLEIWHNYFDFKLKLRFEAKTFADFGLSNTTTVRLINNPQYGVLLNPSRAEVLAKAKQLDPFCLLTFGTFDPLNDPALVSPVRVVAKVATKRFQN